MIKKIFFVLAGLFFTILPSMADGKHEMVLKEGERQIESFDVGNLYRVQVQMSPNQDDNRKVGIRIWLENLSSLETMYVFYQEYTEKELKKSGIRYDSRFGGDRGKRVTECILPRSDEARTYMCIPPTDDSMIIDAGKIGEGEKIDCVIPVYFARIKGFLFFKNWTFLEKRTEQISITVQLMPDTRYENLTSEVETLSNKFAKDTIVICKHPSYIESHYPPEEDQLKSRRIQIDSMRREVKKELESRNASQGSVVFNDFSGILEKLDSLDINLGKIPISIHKLPNECGCPVKIRKMSLKAIYDRLDDYYQALYFGKKSRASIMGEVDALYKHSKHITKDPKKFKKGIEENYFAIKNFSK